MMDKAIKDFPQQFLFKPKVAFGAPKKRFTQVIVAGMGGSHLAADLLRAAYPDLPLSVHADYGLPPIAQSAKKTTAVVISSYSGTTEEAIDALASARRGKIACAALSVGGTLRTLARTHKIPFVQLPDTGIQPRLALGYSLLGLCALLGFKKISAELPLLAHTLQSARAEAQGKELAAVLKGRIPVIYASSRNAAVATNWKIKFNETGKIPAFYNVFPELNHNEMTGFDSIRSTRALSRNFSFIILKDPADHPRIQLRMDALASLYKKRGLPVRFVPISGENRWHAIFSSLLFADWTAYHTARSAGAEPEQVPMVESFKKML